MKTHRTWGTSNNLPIQTHKASLTQCCTEKRRLNKFWISAEWIIAKFKSMAKHYQNWGLPIPRDVILKVDGFVWWQIKPPWQLWKVHLCPKAVLELSTAAKTVSCCTHLAGSGGCFIFTLRNQTQNPQTPQHFGDTAEDFFSLPLTANKAGGGGTTGSPYR